MDEKFFNMYNYLRNSHIDFRVVGRCTLKVYADGGRTVWYTYEREPRPHWRCRVETIRGTTSETTCEYNEEALALLD